MIENHLTRAFHSVRKVELTISRDDYALRESMPTSSAVFPWDQPAPFEDELRAVHYSGRRCRSGQQKDIVTKPSLTAILLCRQAPKRQQDLLNAAARRGRTVEHTP